MHTQCELTRGWSLLAAAVLSVNSLHGYRHDRLQSSLPVPAQSCTIVLMCPNLRPASGALPPDSTGPPGRAERFSTQYRDPGRVRKDFGLMMEARREKFKQHHGFTTGSLDLLSKVRGGACGIVASEVGAGGTAEGHTGWCWCQRPNTRKRARLSGRASPALRAASTSGHGWRAPEVPAACRR